MMSGIDPEEGQLSDQTPYAVEERLREEMRREEASQKDQHMATVMKNNFVALGVHPPPEVEKRVSRSRNNPDEPRPLLTKSPRTPEEIRSGRKEGHSFEGAGEAGELRRQISIFKEALDFMRKENEELKMLLSEQKEVNRVNKALLADVLNEQASAQQQRSELCHGLGAMKEQAEEQAQFLKGTGFHTADLSMATHDISLISRE